LNCAVLGCTGIVGQRFIKLLEDHPYFDLKIIVASTKNKDKIYKDAVHWIIEDDIPEFAKDLKINLFDINKIKQKNIKVVFCALPPKIAKDIEKNCANNSTAVFTNSRAHRYDLDVPILIPEANAEHIKLVESQKTKGFIITNANCTTTGLALALAPIRKYKIKKVFITSYQALSGAGYPGVSSLDINGNVVPFIDGEEEKIIIETKKILGKLADKKIKNIDYQIYPHCARVAVKEGHLESVFVELQKDFNLKKIKKDFENFNSLAGLPTSPKRPIIVKSQDNRPQPQLDRYAGSSEQSKGMSISIGRLKKQDNFLSFYLLVHNTIRGAAGNSVLNAEFAYKNGFLDALIRGD
jgi:aspartate-semialdehyde dehydrogenase